MPGVKAILTVDDLPACAAGAELGENVTRIDAQTERGLTMEPLYEGEPILAVAAVDELTAAEAIERFRSSTSRCRSSSIRSPACVPAARTRGRKATSGCRHARHGRHRRRVSQSARASDRAPAPRAVRKSTS